MIGRIHSRSTFEALRSSRLRSSSGPVRIVRVDGDEFDRPCVAFAIGRKVGNAVVRNRLRRQLRAISLELAPALKPGAYLIGVSATAATLPYEKLKESVSAAMTAILQRGAK